MLATSPPRPATAEDLARLGDDIERLMTSAQAEGVGRLEPAGWARIETALATVLDSAIALVPDVARRWVVAQQRLGWLLRGGLEAAELDDRVVDDLETLLECLLAYEEGLPVGEDRTPQELVLWLMETLDLSQARVAAMLAVSLRTLQRWLSGQGRPGARDAGRIRRLARLVNQARFALTGPGVVAWLERPSAYLGGSTPGQLVISEESGADAELERLASTLRYG